MCITIKKNLIKTHKQAVCVFYPSPVTFIILILGLFWSFRRVVFWKSPWRLHRSLHVIIAIGNGGVLCNSAVTHMRGYSARIPASTL